MYFNPLPHTRENRLYTLPRQRQGGISIHSLIRGRTFSSFSISSIMPYFNPLPHTRENAETIDRGFGGGEISIHSLIRGRTQFKRNRISNQSISIHSLIRGRTSASVTGKSAGGHFNPLPHTRENRVLRTTL